MPMPPGARTLAHHFRDAGYATGYIGKWHLADPDVAGPVAPGERGGYDYWLASNLLEFTSDAYQTTLYDEESRAVHLPGYRVLLQELRMLGSQGFFGMRRPATNRSG